MVKQIASDIVQAFKDQPLLLGIMVINLFVLLGLWFLLSEVSQSLERKDKLIASLTEKCIDGRPH